MEVCLPRRWMKWEFFHCCLRICCRGNEFTQSLPSNERLHWLYYSGFRTSCHNIINVILSSCHKLLVKFDKQTKNVNTLQKTHFEILCTTFWSTPFQILLTVHSVQSRGKTEHCSLKTYGVWFMTWDISSDQIKQKEYSLSDKWKCEQFEC
jgi:uncharacterized membrane protein